MNIYHNSRETEYRDPFGAAEAGSLVRLKLDISGETGEISTLYDGSGEVMLRLWHDETGETLVPMNIVAQSAGYLSSEQTLTFETEITMPEETGVLWYYFMIKVNGRTVYYGNNVNNTGGEGCMSDMQPSSYQITVYRYAPVPSWYKDAIVYQIFPDRFARDDNWRDRCQNAADSADGRKGQRKFIEEDWYKSAYYEKDEKGNVTGWPFYGGSLRGIEDKLDYLASMGVGAVYLNPIFAASSNHRYDTADYMTIDPMLGDEEDFRHLADACEQRGIKLILDGVFSHVGADSIYFDKYGNFGGEGAYENEDSKYRNWFEFKDDDPVGYRSWWGVSDLPEVNEDEESFRELICGENGVIAKWLRAGASGWRLDVADELPDDFIKAIRRRIKTEGQDNLLLGEVWEDASNKTSYGQKRQYLMGDELDSTMNYPIRDLLIDFVLFKKGAWETGDRLMSLAENYPAENFYGALNLIGSHDRARIITVMGAETNYDMAALRVGMLAMLSYTLPGVPCVYYGDEAAMMGGPDPDNRGGFIWGRENVGMQKYYRQLGLIYHQHPVLKSGQLRIIDTGSQDVLGFLRDGEGEKILVLANRMNCETVIPAERLEDIEGNYALELLTSNELEISCGHIVNDIAVGPFGSKLICIREEVPATPEMTRSAGVICHISSLPGGTIGRPARDFVDYIVSAGFKNWQILPINPPGIGDSPYSSYASMAGNPQFIDRNELPDMSGYDEFCRENEKWLESYVKYAAGDNGEATEQKRIEQYYFAVQWSRLKEYANSKGVMIIGDLPVFVSADSADTAAYGDLFRMDEEGHLRCHAGVPPDYFAVDGQDWGNPLYDWRKMKEDGYGWWTERLKQCFERYDYVRLDHFRSFSEYYAIPEGETPVNGTWQPGPGLEFFEKIKANLGVQGCLRIIAEDLGQLDSGVYNLLKLSGFPGMNVYQFSADEMMAMSDKEMSRRVFYTGTHDNQTLLGWCRDSGMDEGDALAIIRKLYECDVPWVMLQIQDVFMLGDEARINVPGVAEGNWKWKIPGDSIKEGIRHADKIAAAFRKLAVETGRAGDGNA